MIAVPTPPHLQSLSVLGLGICGIDMLAQVPSFPQPNQKIRTTATRLQGGGNTANSITGLRRLGIPCHFISHTGCDAHADLALRQLTEDGVQLSHLVQSPNLQTTFTYVIIDNQSSTRTCISTPTPPLSPSAVPDAALDNVKLLMLDGRHGAAALRLAKVARRRNIPILLDVERPREYGQQLFELADYIVTNDTFPSTFDSAGGSPALSKMLRLGRAKLIVSTLGEKGCIMMARSEGAPEIVETCPACHVSHLVDTTGAGDAFIAGIAYGILTHMQYPSMLRLASWIAARSVEGVGARDTLPRREHVPEHLLNPIPT